MNYRDIAEAAFFGDIEDVQSLLEEGKDINENNSCGGYTALQWAAYKGKTDIVRLLIDKGVDLDSAHYKISIDPLVMAKWGNHTEIIRMLEEAPKRRLQQAKAKAKADANAIKAFKKFAAPSADQSLDKKLTDAVAAGNCDQARQALDLSFWRKEPIAVHWHHLKTALERRDKPMLRLLITWGATIPDQDLSKLEPPQRALLRQCGFRGSPAAPVVKENAQIGDIMPDGSIYAGIAPETGQVRYVTKAGEVMPDGTIYAGLSPSTGKALYVAPQDAPLHMFFNAAAYYAEKLEVGGKKDFRLPTKEELNLLYQSRRKGAFKGTFNVTGSNKAGWYWSSTHGRDYSNWGQCFRGGAQQDYTINHDSSVRCVRS